MIAQLCGNYYAAFSVLKGRYRSPMYFSVIGKRKEIQCMVIGDPNIISFHIFQISFGIFKILIKKSLISIPTIFNDRRRDFLCLSS